MPLPGAAERVRRRSTRKGDQWYWRADFVSEIPDEAIDEHAEHGAAAADLAVDDAPLPDRRRGRTTSGPTDTAWAYRDANWGAVIVGVDPDPANAETISAWTRDYWEALHPYSAGGAYVNMMMDEGHDRVRATYRDNYERLAQIKAEYDPDEPASGSTRTSRRRAERRRDRARRRAPASRGG